MIPYIVPTAEVKTIDVGPPDRRRSITVQVCDLYLPNKRHPLDYEYNIQDGQLTPDEKHFLSGDTLFQPNRYGVEVNQYGIKWINQRSYYESLTKLLKG